MKKLGLIEIATMFLIAIITVFGAFKIDKVKPEYDPLKTTYYNSTGRITKAYKVWDGIISPSAGSSQTIDISSAAFTGIATIELTAANNTTTVTSMPLAVIQSYTSTSITYNVLTSNVGVLSILQGLVTTPSITGMTVHAHVTGW